MGIHREPVCEDITCASRVEARAGSRPPDRPGRYGRSLGRDEEGLSHIIEFSLSLVVVLIVLAGYFTAVDNEFIIHTPDDSKRERECIRLSDRIIGDPGQARLGPNQTTSIWEDHDAVFLSKNLTRAGLARDGSPFGILSREKVDGLRNVTYHGLRNLFAIRQYHFNLEIVAANGTRIVFFGYSHLGARKLSEVQRVILLENGTTVEPCSMYVRLFEGVNRRSLVTVSEIMYFPTEGKNEWIELHNPSHEAVDLSTLGMYFQDGQIFRNLLQGDPFILPGGGYAVVIDHPDTPARYGFSPDTPILTIREQRFGRSGLRNDGMFFFIQGEPFRTWNYSYNSTMGAAGNGRSLEWSYEHGEWQESMVDGGTPGYRNSFS